MRRIVVARRASRFLKPVRSTLPRPLSVAISEAKFRQPHGGGAKQCPLVCIDNAATNSIAA
jgi:hypothetical protein